MSEGTVRSGGWWPCKKRPGEGLLKVPRAQAVWAAEGAGPQSRKHPHQALTTGAFISDFQPQDWAIKMSCGWSSLSVILHEGSPSELSLAGFYFSRCGPTEIKSWGKPPHHPDSTLRAGSRYLFSSPENTLWRLEHREYWPAGGQCRAHKSE